MLNVCCWMQFFKLRKTTHWVATLSLDPAASLTKRFETFQESRSKHFSRKVHISPTNSIYTKSTSRRVWTVKKPISAKIRRAPPSPPHLLLPKAFKNTIFRNRKLNGRELALTSQGVGKFLPKGSWFSWTWKSLDKPSEMIHIRLVVEPTHVKNYAKVKLDQFLTPSSRGEK